MKMKFTGLCLALAGAAWSMDEYLPVEPGMLEVDVGYSFSNLTGIFNADGERVDLASSQTGHLIPVQFKYGIRPGLDVELAMGMSLTENASGLNRPELGIKYADMNLGAGVYANLLLPFRTGDLAAGADPGLGIEIGGVYQNRFGDFRLTGRTGYILNLEADNVREPGIFHFLVKPEAMWTEHIGTYLGAQFILAGESEFNGTGMGNDGYLLSLIPGLNVQLLNNLAYEIAVPIGVLGKNAGASWGVTALLYWTVPL